MKKQLVMGGAAIVSMLAFTGCQMCVAPIPGDPSCIEPTHIRETNVNPDVVDYTKPMITKTKDVFRPVFKAGNVRVTAVGSGNSLEEATADAVAKILTENKCDYLVSVTRIITQKTHPAGFFRWPTTNYTVSISGLPITLDKLEKEEAKPLPPPQPTCKCPSKDELIVIITEIVNKIIKIQPQAPAQAPFTLVKLTDINLSMTAKAAAKDPVALAVPPPAPAPEKK